MAFFDFIAAFDSVPKKQIWKALEQIEVPQKLRRVIKSVSEHVYGGG